MSIEIGAGRIARRWCAAAMLAMCCTPSGAQADPLSTLYARYLSGGRSDVEIHLSAAGAHASARLRQLADGSFHCRVSGLREADSFVSNSYHTRTAGLRLSALLVHEVTHCLVAPHTANLTPTDEGPAAPAVARLLALTAESISDARAVIEVFRQDGAQAAQALVAIMLPQRMAARDFSHGTAMALREALAHTQHAPASLQTAEQAFAAALEIGQRCAWLTLQHRLFADDSTADALTPELLRSRAKLEAALARAAHAFSNGRFANDALTVHHSADGVTTSDQHVFVAADGSTRSLPVIGAEGAHSLQALQGLISASQAPEHLLAVQWLQRAGQLDVHTLMRARQILARFIHTVSQGNPAQMARAGHVLGEAIHHSGRGQDLSVLLDDAAQRLQAALRL